MKVFCSLLLLMNIIFGLLQWLLPYERLSVQRVDIELAERLQLLTEVGQSTLVDESPDSQSGNQQVCYAVGPFKDKKRALQMSRRYSAVNIKTELKSNTEQEYMGVIVYLAGHETRDQAVKTTERLAKDGIRDYIIINQPNRTNVVSLGVFELKKNAERLSNRLKKLHYSECG